MTHSLVTLGLVALMAAQSGDPTETKARPAKNVAAKQESSKLVRPRLDSSMIPVPERPVARPLRAQGPSQRLQRPQAAGTPAVAVAAPVQQAVAILPLQHMPAAAAAHALEQWAGAVPRSKNQPPMAVIPIDTQNCLLVMCVPKQLEAIRAIVKGLDTPVAQVRVKMALVELKGNRDDEQVASEKKQVLPGDIDAAINALKKSHMVRMICRPEIVALDSQPASVHYGSRVPRIVGAMTGRGGRINNVEMENVGTMVELVARVHDPHGVTLQIEWEQSYLGPEDEGTAISGTTESPEIRVAGIETIELKTTVTVTTGKTAVLSVFEQSRNAAPSKKVLLVQADILK